ncbi:hypothetical protein SCHPADRAFT_836260, partial [Schizopora paradoxa]
MWRDRDISQKDGSDWSVQPDWESTMDLPHSLFTISATLPETPLDPLEAKFASDPFFLPIVKFLLDHLPLNSSRERKRAQHRAAGYFIENGTLWKLMTKGTDRVPKVECLPSSSGFTTALHCHQANGHFGRDLLKLHLRDKYFWTGM